MLNNLQIHLRTDIRINNSHVHAHNSEVNPSGNPCQNKRTQTRQMYTGKEVDTIASQSTVGLCTEALPHLVSLYLTRPHRSPCQVTGLLKHGVKISVKSIIL